MSAISMMNRGILTQWLADLRDGTRVQGFNRLRDENGRQCCLDVLCEQAVRAGILAEPTMTLYGTGYVYKWVDGERSQEEEGSLPGIVAEWAGLGNEINPEVLFGESDEMTDLAALNDQYGKTFAEIADLIEEEANRDWESEVR